jgi:cytochrome c
LYVVIKRCVIGAIAILASGAAQAGDAAKGEVIFEQCHQCHSPAQGVNVVGPSLYRVVGRPAGSIAGYAYSKAMQEAAQKGLVWMPENIVAYLKDPHKFLDDFAGDPGAPNKMPFSLEDQTQREDVVAYLQSQASK